MSDSFGTIYGRILDKSGIGFDNGTYISTGGLLSNLRKYDDSTVKVLDDSTKSCTAMVNRMNSASFSVEDVRLDVGKHKPHRWSYNPFWMLFNKYLEFSEYRNSLRAAKKAISEDREPNTKALAKMMVGLTPKVIIKEWQPVYRLMMGIPEGLLHGLVEIKYYHRDRSETARRPNFSELSICVTKHSSGDREWLNGVHEKKRKFTKKMVEGLAGCLHDDKSLDHLQKVISAIKTVYYKPGWDQQFLTQAERLNRIETDRVPDEWTELPLKREAVQAESKNLEERYRKTWRFRVNSR